MLYGQDVFVLYRVRYSTVQHVHTVYTRNQNSQCVGGAGERGWYCCRGRGKERVGTGRVGAGAGPCECGTQTHTQEPASEREGGREGEGARALPETCPLHTRTSANLRLLPTITLARQLTGNHKGRQTWRLRPFHHDLTLGGTHLTCIWQQSRHRQASRELLALEEHNVPEAKLWARTISGAFGPGRGF